jgi:hypothetical protein
MITNHSFIYFLFQYIAGVLERGLSNGCAELSNTWYNMKFVNIIIFNSDLGMQMNLCLFELNNRCGYVLKPESLRKKDRSFNPLTTENVENVVMNTLSIQVR